MFLKKCTVYCTCHEKATTKMLNNTHENLMKIYERNKVLKMPRRRSYTERNSLVELNSNSGGK